MSVKGGQGRGEAGGKGRGGWAGRWAAGLESPQCPRYNELVIF